jgi:hypothetical protein
MDIGQLYLRHNRQAPETGAGRRKPNIVRDIYQILAALGHPDRIAESLIRDKASGTKGDSASCVLAEHLKAVTGYSTVLVGRNATKYPGGVIEHPVEIRAFLWRVDSGYYPQLETAPELTKQDVVLM